MRVLLVQQEMGRRNRLKPIFPLGLAYLAASLEKKHTVKIFDPNLYSLSESFRDLESEIRSFNPQVVGLSIKYIDTTQIRDRFIFYNAVVPQVQAIKQISPDTLIIVGGSGFSLFSREIMEDMPAVDFGVYLEGEESFLELLDNLDRPNTVRGIFYRTNGAIKFSGHREPPVLETLLYPIRNTEVVNIHNYISSDYQIFGIQTKRGCQFNCSYCNYPFLTGGKIRLRDPKSVVDEIEFMKRTYALKSFTFIDNIFNFPPAHMQEMCLELIKRGLFVEWGAWFDLAHFSEDQADLAIRAGCRYIDFSPDAATQEGLDGLQKGINMQDIHQSAVIAKEKKDVVFSYNFFISHPCQNFRGVLETLSVLSSILVMLWGRVRFSIGWIRIEPFTALYRTAIREKIISERTNLFVKDAGELKKIFYTKHSLWFIDVFFLAMLNIADYLVKPILRCLFRMKGKRYPFYYE